MAARAIAAVRDGRSLSEALRALAGEPAAARAAAQDVAYGVFRRHGQGDFILSKLLSKALGHAETEALLLAALYRIETRPEAVHTVVDQAVAASATLVGGALKGLVNGVLRNYLRQRETLLAELERNDVAVHAHPAWWLARLRRAYPEQWPAIVAAGNAPPRATVLRAIEAIKDNKSAYLMAVGGAAYLVAKAIKSAKVVGFADLGMEAIYEFDVQDMPVTVAVDSSGTSVHNTGPKEWQAKIGKIPVKVG